MSDASETRVYPWLECDPEIASDLSSALMDAFGVVEETEDSYEITVPASVVEWTERNIGKFTNTDGMDVEELDFPSIVCQAVFVFLGGVIGKSLCDHGYKSMLQGLGAEKFMTSSNLSDLVPIGELHEQSAILH